MKKILAIILSVLLVFSLTACAGEDDVRGEINPGSSEQSSNNDPKGDQNDTTGSTEKEFDTGSVSANKYENKFLGISCELGAGWTFMTDEQIRQNNETALGLIGEEYAEAIKNATTFTDMMAVHSNQTDTLNITFEKLTGANLVLTEEQYVNLSKDSLKSALENMGMTNVTLTTGKETFAGENHPYIEISAQYNGVPVFERVAIVKCQNYMVNIVACTWQTNNCKSILNAFKAA